MSYYLKKNIFFKIFHKMTLRNLDLVNLKNFMPSHMTCKRDDNIIPRIVVGEKSSPVQSPFFAPSCAQKNK